MDLVTAENLTNKWHLNCFLFNTFYLGEDYDTCSYYCRLFATGLISNINLGSRMNKSFATGFKGQLIQISEKERIGIDKEKMRQKKS